MRKIKDIAVINEESASAFRASLKVEVDGMQEKGLEVEIKDSRLTIAPDYASSFHYIAVIVGYETSELPDNEEISRYKLDLDTEVEGYPYLAEEITPLF